MFLYAISDGEYIKVGITWDIHARMSQLQTANARKLSLICSKDCVSVQNAEFQERDLKLILKELRVSGEWFDVPIQTIRDHFDSLPEFEKPPTDMTPRRSPFDRSV